MRKYYNFDTAFSSLRDQLREYLKSNNIYYELSGARAAYHFEILLNPVELAAANAFLDSITINEV